MRALSLFWGLVALASWYLILKALSGQTSVALLGAGLLASDFYFTASSATARMDMMSASLGFAGLAAYLSLRRRSTGLAATAHRKGRAILFNRISAAASPPPLRKSPFRVYGLPRQDR